MKGNKFEEIIAQSVAKLKTTLPPNDLASFQQQLTTLPKKVKQFNAEPYLFIFDLMLKRKQLIQPALASLATMLEQNYITSSLYDRLALAVTPLLADYSYAAVQLISKIKQPNLAFLQMYFDIHSTVALPEDNLRKFKALGYAWLVRAFSLTDRPLPPFVVSIYAKFYPEEMPKLLKVEQEQQQIRKYVGLLLGQCVLKIEQQLEQRKGGKYNFCFVCTQPAEYYCKDTRVSVCGVVCKKQHLEMLVKANCLNFQYSSAFCRKVEQLLVTNLARKRSPALSIDFLIAIYLYSGFIPQTPLPHSKILCQPVIFERIWVLYLSYYGKMGQNFEHILVAGLGNENSQFVRQMATEYFMIIAGEQRLIDVFIAYDHGGDYRLLTTVLHNIEESRQADFIALLVDNVFDHYSPNSHVSDDGERAVIRALNHAKQLNRQSLLQLFGEDYQDKLIRFIIRNELELNRQKLGEYLYQNEDTCRKFLRAISTKKAKAPIDELLREIFYFINVKISDKIYHLFELLAEIYEPQQPFNELNFFTYTYFIVMVVTELNNPAVAQKPTIASVLARVEQFSSNLAKNHSHIVEGMFERVSNFPFSQTSRGILAYYQPVSIAENKDFHPEQIVISNWEFIYEKLIGSKAEVTTIFRICSLLVNHPPICQTFLRLLVDRLYTQPRDQFLVKAIANIIDLQPNAALWKPIFQEINASLFVTAPPSGHILSLGQIIQSTSLLTDDNFYVFTRQLCSQFQMVQNIDYFLQLIKLNRIRIAAVIQLFASNFQKSTNSYFQLQAIKKLGRYLEDNPEQNCCSLLLHMLRGVTVIPINQGLLLDCLLFVNFDRFDKAAEFWNLVTHKCLLMQDDKKVTVLETLLKSSKLCESYQSYLIQKTLNSHREALISEDILHNLHKLEPYLQEIAPECLQLFLLPENIGTILDHFQYFCNINKTYHLLLSHLDKGALQGERITPMISTMGELLKKQWGDRQDTVLKLDALPIVLVRLLEVYDTEIVITLLEDYARHLQISNTVSELTQPILKQKLMAITSIAILAQSFAEFTPNIEHIVKTNRQQSDQSQKNIFKKLVNPLQILHQQTLSYQTNIPLRIAIKTFIKTDWPHPHLPSAIATCINLCRTIYQLQSILDHPIETALIELVHQVDSVIERQTNANIEAKKFGKVQGLLRIGLIECNKDALKYGEMMIDTTHDYLSKQRGDLSSKNKGTLKRILLSILVQGFFNESTCSFQSLADSAMAQKATEIFHLLK